MALRKTARRHFLAGTAAALLGAALRPPRAAAETVPANTVSDARLLLGGTLASLPGQFATLAAPGLSRALKLESPIQLVPDVGQDGVGAANRFDLASGPDGSSAVAVPASTLLAALSGDPRVHYDPARWAPLLSAQTTTVLVLRDSFRLRPGGRLRGLIEDRPARLAVSRPTTDLDAMLGLTLLGLHPLPVPGFLTGEDGLKALAEGTVDAVQLRPDAVQEPMAALLARLPPGASAIYRVGDAPLPGAEQPGIGNLPGFAEAFQQTHRGAPSGPLYRAWQAVSAGTCAALTVALPMLTPPDLVGQWRHAFAMVAADPAIREWAQARGFRLLAGDAAAPSLTRASADLGAVLALRRWVAMNTPRWRSGQETRI